MKYLVGISGGIDSVVLLHKLVAGAEHELIVAHFDHGIRRDSADDARFVAGLAAQYGLPFVSERKELGPNASEDQARRHRYAFLRKLAHEHQAVIVTAHHKNDIIETIAINIMRGTGWRGVAVMQTAGILRPLLDISKAEIRAYALANRLEWTEDSTNSSDKYLRNRLRRLINNQITADGRRLLLDIWQRQLVLRMAIEDELVKIGPEYGHSRYFYTLIDEKSAAELLRATIMASTQTSPTRPQLTRAVLAMKTARPNTTVEIGDGVKLLFSVRSFIVETP